MRHLFLSLIKQFLFWIFFFALNRAVFLTYYNHLVSIEQPGTGEVLAGFWHALRLDISTAAYILIVPFFLLLLKIIVNKRWIDLIIKGYTFMMIITYTLITTAELGIYGEWKTKLHYKALLYLSNPDEVYNSAGTGQFIGLLIIFIFLVTAGSLAYHYVFHHRFLIKRRHPVPVLLYIVLIPGFIFLGIRGGMQPIPITHSQSFYSKHNILNIAAVNSGYSFLFSVLENYRFLKETPYRFMEEEKARKIVDRLNHVEKDTTVHILNIKRPNIVILLLESWSADLVHSLGGEPGITPEFEKLAEEGILFTDFYASGNRSEQAMSSIFGGFPATPIAAITHSLDKVTALPSLPQKMKAEGYNTSFYFGGHLMYGGIKSYLSIAGFEEMKEIYDFPDSIPRGKLGIHDEYIFDHQLQAMDNKMEPFFSVVFSLSTHSPYDQPMQKVLDWGGSENEYINSAYYTDQCLGYYFREASSKDWYDSTLFIIVADHSHNSYRHWHVTSPEYRKIPMLFYGEVIKDEFRGTTNAHLSSQTDIPATTLQQLDLNASDFIWSRDLFNPYKNEFVFYEATNGLGWIRPEGYFVWHKNYGYLDMDLPEDRKEEIITEGKAYLQVLFGQFLEY